MSLVHVRMQTMSKDWTVVPPVVRLSGTERFVGIDANVTDFWSFALSDIKMNNARGYLAEFLVAKAVGADAVRIEWDAFDVATSSGITIEVKSSAYIQAWEQQGISTISFTGLRGRTWNPLTGSAPEATYNADVYVFCVETAKTHDEYNPLDVSQWEFYVVPKAVIESTGYNSIGLTNLTKLAGAPVAYANLAEAIATAHEPTNG